MLVMATEDCRDMQPDGTQATTLTPRLVYFVLGVSQDMIRIIDDAGEPILYPKRLLRLIDGRVPAGWRYDEFDDGEYHLEPYEVARAGFYEEYFNSDGDLAAQAEARCTLLRALEAAKGVAVQKERLILERDMERFLRAIAAPSRSPQR